MVAAVVEEEEAAAAEGDIKILSISLMTFLAGEATPTTTTCLLVASTSVLFSIGAGRQAIRLERQGNEQAETQKQSGSQSGRQDNQDTGQRKKKVIS